MSNCDDRVRPAFQMGFKEGIEALSRECNKRALAILRALTSDSHLTRDIIQTALAELLHTQPPGLLEAPCRFFSTVVRRRAIDELRKRARIKFVEESVANSTNESDSSDIDFLAVLEDKAVLIHLLSTSGLTYLELTTLWSIFIEGREPVEIAKDQGVPANRVRQRRHRALKKLRDRLDDMGETRET